MALKLNLEKYPEWSKFDQESQSRANWALGSLRNFRFLIVWTIMVKALSYIKGPIKKIQGRSLDLYEVVDVIRNTQTNLRLLKFEESDFYQRCYNYAIRICYLIGTEPSMPRIAEKQVPRENTPAAMPYDYYCVNVCSPFLRSQFLKLLSFIKTIWHALTYWMKSSENGKISGGQQNHRADQILLQNH